ELLSRRHAGCAVVSSERPRPGSENQGKARRTAAARRILRQEKKMIDIQLLRNDLDTVAKRLATRAGYALDVARFRELDSRRKEMQQAVEGAQAERNRVAKEIGQAKAKK